LDSAARPHGIGSSTEILTREAGPDWLVAALWGFVGLGLLLRIVRFLVCYPIWHDEAFVAVNFLDRGYLDLLRPLDYSQVCPLFFLWVELTTVKLLGYSEWSLRLFPTICALASVGLFWDVSRRVTRGIPHLLAVAIFAVSFTPLRHGAEVKPYASDLLAALILLRIALGWIRNPSSSRGLWIMAVVAPVMLGLSYPAVFVASGVCLALAPRALSQPSRVVRVSFLLCNASVLLSFLALFAAFTTAQSAELTANYRWGYWLDSFPPLGRPWLIPWWLARTHVGKLMAYPVGGEAGASVVTLVCVLVGVGSLWKQGRRGDVGILGAPFGMGLLAAFLGRYPYGGEARFMQYLAPATCLLMGIGLAAIIDRGPVLNVWFDRRIGVLLTLAILGISQMLLDFVKPYRDKEDVLSRRFAQWLWTGQAQGAELICARTDLGLMLDANPLTWQRGMSSIYRCYQALYSPRLQRREAPDLSRISDSHPLRIVFFDQLPSANPEFSKWLSSLERKFDLRHQANYVVFPPKTKDSWKHDGCVVLEFIPKPESDSHRDVASRDDIFPGRF
jgi:Dolichyl-phosphate-mannose-protein mannosyltransferase